MPWQSFLGAHSCRGGLFDVRLMRIASKLQFFLSGSATAFVMAISVGLLAATAMEPDVSDPGAWRLWQAQAIANSWMDPSTVVKAAENCMSSHWDVLETALVANSRKTDVILWLAFLAEHGGRTQDAESFLLQACRQDQSFRPLWTYWNFLRRTGEIARAKAFDHQIVLRAPPRFRAHYPILWDEGWAAEQVFDIVRSGGKPSQMLGLLKFLVESARPDAGPLVSRLLDVQTNGDLPEVELREIALQVVAQGVAGQRPIQEAAQLWTEAIRETTAGGNIIRIVRDKRESDSDHPLWNYNPTLRLPFVPRSFDWSVIQGKAGDGESLSSALGGLRIRIYGDNSIHRVLLARMLPVSPGLRRIGLSVEWGMSSKMRCPGAFSWELRDRLGVEVVATAGAFSDSSAQAGSTPEIKLELPISGSHECLQLLLVHTRPVEAACVPDEIAIHRIRVAPLYEPQFMHVIQ
jgi:hypothetical protein